MIQVTLSVTASQLAAIAAIMSGGEITPETKAKAEPRAAKPKTEEPEVKAKPEVQGKDAAGDDVAEVPDQAAVTAAAQKLAGKNGRDALVEMLDKYGAKQVSGVPEDKRQAFIDAVEAALA